jgi:hypothetical protein
MSGLLKLGYLSCSGAAKRRGWYLEPAWSRAFGSSDRSISLSGGFLFGW